MIRQFTGLPGSGKSYAATSDAIEEMRAGFRVIFHNMEMNHGEMAAYLKEKGYEPDFAHRLRKLPEDRVRDFWQYAKEQGVESGRLFIIDEAHVFFDSRAWAEIGPYMSRYLTQHRHLNDELLFVTQHPDMLDKRIRLLVAQTTAFRNLRTERWLQWFRPPSWMLWAEYYGMPQHHQKPSAVGKRKLDLRIAACYQTSVGHGGLGRSGGPEKERPKKRLPAVALIILALLGVYVISVGPEAVIKWILGKTMTAAKETRAQQTAPVDPGQPIVTQAGARSATKEPTPPPRVRGYVADSKGLRILLDDGRVITQEDKPYRKGGRLYWSTGESAIFTR